MTTRKTYTQQQLEEARAKLEAMPDLSPNKIPESEFLDSLKQQIVALARDKGYDQGEIRKLLDELGVKVSAKAISEIIKPTKKPRVPRTPKAVSRSEA